MKHDAIREIPTAPCREPFFEYLHQVLPRVVQLEYGSWDQERGFLRHSHDDLYQVDFFVAGQGLYRLQEAESPIGPERVFVVAPGVEHELRASPDEPLRGFSLKFELPGFTKPFLPPVLVVDPNHSGRIEGLFRLAVGDTALDDADRTVAISLGVLRLLVYLARLHSGHGIDATGNPVVKAAQHFLESHFAEPLSLEQIAVAVGVTREHLCRLFQENLKTTPLTELRKKRCEFACLRLANTRDSLSTIAKAAGFGSAQNMNRAFRTLLGDTPRSYRRKMAMSR